MRSNSIITVFFRYAIGELRLPHVVGWVTNTLGVDLSKPHNGQDPPKELDYPPPKINENIFEKLKSLQISYSIEVMDRVVRAHGHTLHDIFVLRNGYFDRIPDIVLWPESHEDVANIISTANENNVVVSI